MFNYAPFWETLEKKGITQYTLIHKYKLSCGLLDRLRHNQNIRLSSIVDLCEILNCQINDIVQVEEDTQK